ncbi:hypothetical protein HU200_018252 [Digitaria exilis]|uniref:Uncharacterized protein n=1 Tax=Digitaria exilis TaxID=1010633 RepID=A0A835F5A9_9POAL|nr:hypothetical protein HU200_018252 [Digitaria exilis]
MPTGTPFPPNFRDVIKTIMKRLFRLIDRAELAPLNELVESKTQASLGGLCATVLIASHGGLAVDCAQMADGKSAFATAQRMPSGNQQTRTVLARR